LTAIIKTSTQNKTQDYNDENFPLAIAITLKKEIVFGREAEPCPAGWFGLSDGQIFFQPVEGYSVRFNGKKLSDSTWLSDGDRIEIESSILKIAVDNGLLIFSYDSPRKEPVLKPPPAPAEKETGDEDNINPEPGSSTGSGESGFESPDKPDDDSGLSGVPSIAPLPREKSRSRLHKILLCIFLLLVSGVVFVITAVPVTIDISPVPDTVSVSRFPLSLKVGERYLALPGNYRVSAKKARYRELEQTINVGFGKEVIFKFEMVKLPGRLSIKTEPVTGAEVELDGITVGTTPLNSIIVEAGQHELVIVSQRYLPVTEMIDVQGMGKSQSLGIVLQPGWGNLKVQSEPEGAEVLLNGVLAGLTPLDAEPMKGAYEVELKKDGWMPVSKNITIEPGEVIEMEPIRLQKVNGMIVLTTDPAGASVTIDNKFQGYTPISVPIMPEVEHELSIIKSGFSQEVRKFKVPGGQKKQLNVSLKQEYGIVFITSQPADAMLKVDGKEMGNASRRLRLTSRSHDIEIFKEGYDSYFETITPVKGLSKKLDIHLIKHDKSNDVPAEVKTSEGQVLVRVPLEEPVRFKMGTSRREPGRRSNETQYTVELTRSFYISKNEVTNTEFKRFRKEHDSGFENHSSLNLKDQPVTSISWNDAASYLNWLSRKDGLPPVYTEENGRMVAITPVPSGYRLPTEAEWAFAARYQGNIASVDDPLKFPWGDERYPKEKCGNYADKSAEDFLPLIITDYDDGYKVTAPVARFPANALGIYDLGGNVSEWCHDIYDIQSGFSNKVLTDPSGPDSGKYHVVRGSSWRHGSITELRLSYRDYADKGRNDLGFRIVRYEESKK
jgi:formylglycine-generating enzyme required for sulfatase activity